MPFIYLAAILAAEFCMLLIDRRWRLFVFDDTKRALLILAAGTAFFLLWDLVGIALGVFARGASAIMTGWEIIPHLMVEEPFFLVFLCHFTMILFTGGARILSRRAAARDSMVAGA